VDWTALSANPNAVPLLEKNLDKVDWNWPLLSRNPNAIHLLEKNLDKVMWTSLSANPNAIPILEKHLDKVNWSVLSANPNAIHILEKNLDKVDWYLLSKNPNAIDILSKNLRKVPESFYLYGYLYNNPNAIPLFTRLNTKQMRENCKPFAEELAAYVFHPLRLMRLCESYGLELEEYFEMV